MKQLLLSMTVLAILTACDTKKADEHGHDHSEGTHQHEDGSAHENHEEATTPQEEFTVGSDSTSTQEAHNHKYAVGKEHQH
ncbi:hypothetical protein FEDK69T_02540 [Flavobacterium enshiense DK69]|uniref:Lipoprotein n=1 Tax=Flavobacterium enshiense DK69 TaxID=1107311 RepID=V6SF16_9FLAO|nr:hypothetical protein [Flavobacterium enshiense]ESU25064.1 hypothetical protein FEDK69T_02540 [Flavobacterium enshiense DK69]KGO96838.1 hypothetical protein Q767_03815 [Flavobacterium enshiense DK69]